MTDLTEKWKAGELEEGWYYVRTGNGKIGITLYWQDKSIDDEFFSDYDNNDVIDIIAPVPSYEELQALKEENAKLLKAVRLLKYIK